MALLRGTGYLREGWQRIWQPGYKRFLIAPLAINLLLFVALVSWGVRQFNYWLERLMPHLPSWAAFVEWLLWPLFALVVLLVLIFGFSMVANLIASPFYGFLADKVARQERGQPGPDGGWRDLLLTIPRSLSRELRKIGYYLPRLAGLLLLTLVPVANLVASPLLLVFGVWMMAVQYIDYQADNDQVGFTDMLHWMRRRRVLALGFGLPVYIGLLIPLVNLLVMPAAVAGSALLWARENPAPRALP